MDKTVTRSRIAGRLTPPSSKSYAQRAIAAALLSPGTTRLRGMEPCDDVEAALGAAQRLGASVERLGEDYVLTGGIPPFGTTRNFCPLTLDTGESGLATRLFTPIASLYGTPVTLTGRGTILQRPMEMMIRPLEQLGVEVTHNAGRLPLTVRGPMQGGEAQVDGSVSSQFLTGLLLALPLTQRDTALQVSELKSTPYIDMTLAVARAFGVRIEQRDYREFFIPAGQRYACEEYTVEGDWSGASCLLVAGAVAGEITLDNLNPESLQADAAILDALRQAGAQVDAAPSAVTVRRAKLRAFEFEATHCPDLFPALVALAANCEGTSEIRGTSRLQHKESDRASTLQQEFGRLGIAVDLTRPDVMRITGGPIHGATTESHGDHRIAMAVAVAGLNATGRVTVRDAEAVAKSYPRFWEDLSTITI